MPVHDLLRRLALSAARRVWGPRSVSLGRRGEALAARMLRRKGYVIVAGGRRSRFGEIDLIAVQSKSTVVFIEVKARRSLRGGHPAEAVDPEKQRRIANSALAYLKAHGLLHHPARFDVVAIVWRKNAARPESVEHFQNAFEPPGRDRFFG